MGIRESWSSLKRKKQTTGIWGVLNCWKTHHFYLENQLLLISINFTPESSQSCLKKWYKIPRFSSALRFREGSGTLPNRNLGMQPTHLGSAGSASPVVRSLGVGLEKVAFFRRPRVFWVWVWRWRISGWSFLPHFFGVFFFKTKYRGNKP